MENCLGMFVPLDKFLQHLILYITGNHCDRLIPAPLEFLHRRQLMAPHREGAKGSAHRDADEEALQAALQESLEYCLHSEFRFKTR
ncbi:hypothetical protein P3T76_009548 [Phytophthora citrophthora]|uniref:Uncharacterized protein n=1 Tax=Phytophthora citrophthora TaxID=4793 RepID=A0AAD9GG15_9STRA|nr:hypothetical protein P3T76_009548 [Phytophthora citrophthora]